ncbi:MAG TPA: hypothetical protein VFN91_12960 [Myxococcaceae bacterium]|nr:hypothetical protein [Myxococcaceae bacterium]
MTFRVPFLCFSLSLLIAPLALAQQPTPPSPSQEAVAACAGRESGASCPLLHQDRTVTGSCQRLPGGTVACAAEPPPRSRPPPEALEACMGQQDGAACGVAGPRGEPLAGICRGGPPGEPTVCMPTSAPQLPATGGSGR